MSGSNSLARSCSSISCASDTSISAGGGSSKAQSMRSAQATTSAERSMPMCSSRWCWCAPWASVVLGSRSSATGETSSRGLLHDEQVVEPAEKEVPLLRRLAVVAHLQRLVVADDGDDVDRLEADALQA